MTDLTTSLRWIPVTEALPTAEFSVLISVLDRNFRSTLIGIYARAKTLEMHSQCEGGTYSEEDDVYWADEGWYENPHFHDDEEPSWLIENVTHWMPLPLLKEKA